MRGLCARPARVLATREPAMNCKLNCVWQLPKRAEATLVPSMAHTDAIFLEYLAEKLCMVRSLTKLDGHGLLLLICGDHPLLAEET